MTDNPDQSITPESLREAAVLAVKILQDAGYTAYFAGGCVRDSLMGLEPKDYDIATNATPEQVDDLFHKARKVGEAFGVMLIRLKGCSFEVATFRTDGDYTDGRRPDSVCFSTPEHDAERRDFTINGMFYDPIMDEVHDFVGGRSDIESGTLRCIGEPDRRFGEDYLRMLRAVRFAARFDLEIDEKTEAAIRTHVQQLKLISKERIGMEVRSMMKHPNRNRAIQMLDHYGLSNVIFDEQMEVDSLEQALMVQIPQDLEIDEGLYYWFFYRYLRLKPVTQLAKPSSNEYQDACMKAVSRLKHVNKSLWWRDQLKLSNDEMNALKGGIDSLRAMLDWADADKAKRKRALADQYHKFGLMALRLLDDEVLRTPGLRRTWSMADSIQALREEGVSPTPLINGGDLIATGHRPGPAFSAVLDQVYDAQLNGELLEKAEALAYANTLLNA